MPFTMTSLGVATKPVITSPHPSVRGTTPELMEGPCSAGRNGSNRTEAACGCTLVLRMLHCEEGRGTVATRVD